MSFVKGAGKTMTMVRLSDRYAWSKQSSRVLLLFGWRVEGKTRIVEVVVMFTPVTPWNALTASHANL